MKDKNRRNKAKFFMFTLTPTGAMLIWFFGFLFLIGSLLGLLGIVYFAWTSYTTWLIYAEYTSSLYAWSLWNWIPYILVDISFLILSIYMIQCGKKGRK